jgi:hypothetical protein
MSCAVLVHAEVGVWYDECACHAWYVEVYMRACMQVRVWLILIEDGQDLRELAWNQCGGPCASLNTHISVYNFYFTEIFSTFTKICIHKLRLANRKINLLSLLSPDLRQNFAELTSFVIISYTTVTVRPCRIQAMPCIITTSSNQKHTSHVHAWSKIEMPRKPWQSWQTNRIKDTLCPNSEFT